MAFGFRENSKWSNDSGWIWCHGIFDNFGFYDWWRWIKKL